MTAQITIPAIAEDGSLYPIEKLKAHIDGVHHLAVSVFIFDGADLLIQKRAVEKYHCGGLWANTCCTHPHWNEELDVCAERRLQDELGFTLPLQRHQIIEYQADVGGGLVEFERVTLYSASVDRTKLHFKPNPDEVSDTRWVSPFQLAEELSAQPEQFTPWFQIYLRRFPGLKFET